jgi:hypothetical protein
VISEAAREQIVTIPNWVAVPRAVAVTSATIRTIAGMWER